MWELFQAFKLFQNVLSTRSVFKFVIWNATFCTPDRVIPTQHNTIGRSGNNLLYGETVETKGYKREEVLEEV